jgi:hypothetical protein
MQIQEIIQCLRGFVTIKSEVARAHLENNTAVIPAEFIVTASLRKCLKRTLSLSYLTHGIYKEIYPNKFLPYDWRFITSHDGKTEVT